MFKLDRTAFKMQKQDEIRDNNREYWLTRTPQERLAAAWHLTCRAYGIDPAHPPRMDKTAFTLRKRS